MVVVNCVRVELSCFSLVDVFFDFFILQSRRSLHTCTANKFQCDYWPVEAQRAVYRRRPKVAESGSCTNRATTSLVSFVFVLCDHQHHIALSPEAMSRSAVIGFRANE